MKQETNNKPTESGNVNIIYFTTKCNLNCTYCYEDLSNKAKKSTALDDLKKQVDDIIINEPVDKQTLFVLFGGEPTLEWENVKALVEYAYSKKKNSFFNLETNGIKFENDEFLLEFLEFFKDKPHSLDISFDGIGNNLRVDHKGNDSTEILLSVLEKFKYIEMNWRIRYTITKANVNNFAQDVIKLSREFSPKRIITSEDSSGLDASDYIVLNKQKRVLKYLWDNFDINIPICNIFCETCDGCKSSKSEKKYYKDGVLVDTIDVNDNQQEFNHFERKENNDRNNK